MKDAILGDRRLLVPPPPPTHTHTRTYVLPRRPKQLHSSHKNSSHKPIPPKIPITHLEKNQNKTCIFGHWCFYMTCGLGLITLEFCRCTHTAGACYSLAYDLQLGTVKLSRWCHGIPVWSSLIAEKRGADTEWLRRWPREIVRHTSPEFCRFRCNLRRTSWAFQGCQRRSSDSRIHLLDIADRDTTGRKTAFWSNGKKHVFLWKLAPAQEKDWAKGYPKVSPILPFLLPVILHLWQHAFLAVGEEFPGWNLKSS